ncbi:MAG: cell division protein SepF [Armatimonadota bacterium]|nr:MAG: cell division protein SepF [Armatimonadota bacterium]
MSGVLERVKSWLFAEDDGNEAVVPANPDVGSKPRLLLHPRQDEIFVRWPKSLDDAQVCADCLKARRPVVVNLKVLEEHKARRVLDFLGGVVYAIDGHLEQAGDGIYILAPTSMLITAEAEDRSTADTELWAEP